MAPRAAHAFLLYLVLSLAATWPLARGLARDVAWDLGDPILVMWIVSWDVEQIQRLFAGDLSRLWNFFDATIFHPAPLALAYSDHLVPQALQVLPVVLLTDNPILAYNLLFLSTFVLSGLGMFFLVRELTGNGPAALIAGLLFAFAPYRLAQSSHVQVLSSQWMPFVLYGLVRYSRSGGSQPRALAVASLALVAQGLSSGYHLLYFTPFAIAFGIWELVQHRMWRHGRVWFALGVTALAVTATVVPFLLPYATLRAQEFAPRAPAEVSYFSADVYSYVTAFADQRIWGSILQAMPKPEGQLFPGLVPLVLAAIGIAAGSRMGKNAGSRVPDPGSRRIGPRWLTRLLATAAVGYLAAAILTICLRRINVDLWLFTLRMSNINQLLLRAGVLLGLLLLVSPAARARVGGFMRDRGFFVIALAAAAWLSLGPSPQALGRPIEIAAPYAFLYDYVPGYSGLRAPARFAMIVSFMLAALGGYGAAALARTRTGRYGLVALAAFFLLEATYAPFVVNGMSPSDDFNPPEARVYRPARAPAVYHVMAQQPVGSIVAELPIGVPDFDLRAMYYSIVHRHPVVNGYSGSFPPHYRRLHFALSDIPRQPDIALQVLRATGTTHVILHEGAYLGAEGASISAALRQLGAAELFRDGSDVLLRMSP